MKNNHCAVQQKIMQCCQSAIFHQKLKKKKEQRCIQTAHISYYFVITCKLEINEIFKIYRIP